ncbi:MAG: threonine synthase [Deinococcota bacterium]
MMSTPHYYSTRSKDSVQSHLSFQDALLSGLAPDGGLYVPDDIPKIDVNTWQDAGSFTDLAKQVLWAWLADDLARDEFEVIVADALNFPVPLVPVGDDVYVLELFHGPTLSFKDFGARTMARLMNTFLLRAGRTLTILVATSGDTGSAVADGFAGLDNINVVLLYPKGKVSDVQERQLIVRRPGVQALAVEGSFDDCQRMVKAAFVDDELAHLPLSSANSINIGRLLPQSLYYFWAVKQLAQAEPVICVPSGNLGNLTGGVLASLMGLPVGQFLAAHNANDFFPAFLQTLTDAYAFKPTVATVSNAMDVGAPSNFERLEHIFGESTLRERIWGVSVGDETTKTTLQTYAEAGYLACPHTAVGLNAVQTYRQQTQDTRPAVVLATAHPAKFPDVLNEVELNPPQVNALDALFECPTNVLPMAASDAALKNFLLADTMTPTR